MVMNTSFNLAGMPIVESPLDALSCFLDADADLSLLVLFGRVLRRKAFPSDAAAAVPIQQRAFTARTLTDASGEALTVEALVEGEKLLLADSSASVRPNCRKQESKGGYERAGTKHLATYQQWA